MDWQKLATTVAAVIAAVATVAAAIAAAIAAWQTRTAAQANVRVADYMRDQWEADKRAREHERKERLTNLLQSVRSELVVIARVWEQQANQPENAVGAPRHLPTWSNSERGDCRGIPRCSRCGQPRGVDNRRNRDDSGDDMARRAGGGAKLLGAAVASQEGPCCPQYGDRD